MNPKDRFLIQIGNIFDDFRVDCRDCYTDYVIYVHLTKTVLSQDTLTKCFNVGRFSIERSREDFILKFIIEK